MRNAIRILMLTLACLVVLDILVVGVLGLADKRVPALRQLQIYFDYGRSVPGKLQKWEDTPSTPGNLYSVAWMPDVLTNSAEKFAEAAAEDGPVVRTYGMSFVNNITRAAKALQPELVVDGHGGPGAPPNYTYALFLDDWENRQAGDVVVLGILSSSVPALTAISNRTWAFEQPAPFTYPTFRPAEDGGLLRIDPLVLSEAEERALSSDPLAAAAWEVQLRAEDRLYSPVAFGATFLDISPFARMVRRSMAQEAIARRKQQLVEDEIATSEVLRRMVSIFATQARQDDLLPVVFLIQSREPEDLDLFRLLSPILEANTIPYVATAEHFSPRDPRGFLADGHYTREVDTIFAHAFIDLLKENKILP